MVSDDCGGHHVHYRIALPAGNPPPQDMARGVVGKQVTNSILYRTRGENLREFFCVGIAPEGAKYGYAIALPAMSNMMPSSVGAHSLKPALKPRLVNKHFTEYCKNPSCICGQEFLVAKTPVWLRRKAAQ